MNIPAFPLKWPAGWRRAAPSKAEAERVAQALSAYFDRQNKHPYDPLMRAVAAPWPYSAESHAESLKDWERDWRVPRQNKQQERSDGRC